MLRRLRCRVGWHDWQFVLVTARGQVWAMTRCQRCLRQDLGVPMHGERREDRDSAC